MLRFGLIVFNLLLVAYLIWDSFAVIAFHLAEGTSNIFEYVIRCFVVSIPLASLASAIYPLKRPLVYFALALNFLMVLATFFGYYVVIFEGGYKLQAIYIISAISAFTLVFSSNGIAVWLLQRRSLRNS